MKTKYWIWITLVLFTIFTVGAATLSIDIPQADVQRVSQAFGRTMGLGRPATMNEVAFFVRTQYIIPTTYQAEGQAYVVAYQPTPLQMVPTPTATYTPTPTPTGTPSDTATP